MRRVLGVLGIFVTECSELVSVPRARTRAVSERRRREGPAASVRAVS